MDLPVLKLKKNEDRRLREGHCWIFSNEVDTTQTPFKRFIPGEEVAVYAFNQLLLGTAYLNPHSLIAGRLFSRALQRLDLDFIVKKIQIALMGRDQIYSKPYYRLVYGESDGLPGLIVDRYDTVLVVQLNTLGMDQRTDFVLKALLTLLPNTQGILLRNDSSARLLEGLSQEVKIGFGEIPETVLLEENGVSFYAPLSQGQKTGWFFDHRLNRDRLKYYVNRQRVLDVFSYLGGWGIQAAAAQAKEVVCIDSSPLSLEWIPQNAALNRVENKVRVMKADAFDALKQLHQTKSLFDVIILDPPAFIKRQKDKKEGLIAYLRLNELALKCLSPNGILIACSCSQHLAEEELIDLLRRAALKQQVSLQILERGHQGPDHPVHIAIPETSYLKMVMVRMLGEK